MSGSGCGGSAANGPWPAGTTKSEQGGRFYEPKHRLHARSPLRQSLQRTPGRGPLRGRPAAGAPGLRREERLYLVAREYVDEAENGRIADRSESRKKIDGASKPNAPFEQEVTFPQNQST